MYMKPTLFFGGSFLFSQASTHSIAFRSTHIGSGPGVLGLSAMQVNWLLPWRTTRILPSEPTSMIVAPCPIAGGAADMALLMISSSVAQSPIPKRGRPNTLVSVQQVASNHLL